MPDVNADGQCSGCGGSSADVHRIEILRAVTSVEHHPRAGVLRMYRQFTTRQLTLISPYAPVSAPRLPNFTMAAAKSLAN